ncbi:hypothetical protein [Scytonema sp. PRP1]|uniref:hypothetical protein n=1 Tax=Scytonema sp. PRP1 TaxID=3120513 RepID=UPI002FCF1CDE
MNISKRNLNGNYKLLKNLSIALEHCASRDRLLGGSAKLYRLQCSPLESQHFL